MLKTKHLSYLKIFLLLFLYKYVFFSPPNSQTPGSKLGINFDLFFDSNSLSAFKSGQFCL